ncbi:hypothetical protein [Geodermatophilus sabuli]|uniref:EcsC protein family protein n=1 Tax=Geodermatophilus sabuli TaxID=1564158 RepID=A0A285EDL5_9ACTN|nr:hypothetical protein [Geodermatophilus sabuli]MBB3085433.1 hypothetical protein [Geodermatophilus sabuli]SNX96141.1 hypothetical protein SAMN06893097_103310 [Geodermatophilus sabuli]
MTENQQRTGAVRDVPPPRPVAGGGSAAAPSAEEGPLARAGRVLADAVSGLLGGATGSAEGAADAADGRRSAASTLRDVVSAVAAAGSRAGRSAAPGGTPEPDPAADRGPGAPLGDLLGAAVPLLPIRDAARLRAAHPGATDDEIADALVARAARLTSGIGAATGGISAATWFAPPSLLTLPLGLGAETVLTAAVEVVMIGELHELYGRPAPGDARARAAAYLASWSAQRPVDDAVTPGIAVLLGGASLSAIRHRMTRRLARSVPAAAPLLVGAALGGRGNRRATEDLARRVLAGLRGPRP